MRKNTIIFLILMVSISLVNSCKMSDLTPSNLKVDTSNDEQNLLLHTIYQNIFGDLTQSPPPPWPFLNSPKIPDIDQKKLSDETLRIVHQKGIWQEISNAAMEHEIGAVYLGGVSATRIVYHAWLNRRRAAGDLQVSPYKVDSHFDEIFPLYRSELFVFVDTDNVNDMIKFAEDLESRIGSLVSVHVEHLSFVKEQLAADPCSQALVPLIYADHDWQVSSALQQSLATGRLDGTIGHASSVGVLEALNCMSLFAMSPSQQYQSQLTAKLTDKGMYNEAKTDFHKDKLLRRFYQMMAEASDIEKLHHLLNDLNQKEWPLFKVIDQWKLAPKLEEDLVEIKDLIKFLPTKQPIKNSNANKVTIPSIDQFLKSQVQNDFFANHSTRTYDAYRSILMNPYGKINGYISRQGFEGESAVNGNGFYTYNNWDIFYRGFSYTTFFALYPGYFHTRNALSILVLQGGEGYVIYQPKVLEQKLLEVIANNISNPNNIRFGSERRMLMDIAFDCSFSRYKKSALNLPLAFISADKQFIKATIILQKTTKHSSCTSGVEAY